MSIPIQPRFWSSANEHRTVARHRGAQLDLAVDVGVPGLPEHTAEVDFFGARGELRELSQGKREMTRAECSAVMALLERMAAAARAAFGLE